MYNSAFPKKLKLAGQAPTSDEMSLGELIINTTDASLYTKDIYGTVQLIASPAIQSINTLSVINVTALQNLSTNVGDIPVGAGTTQGWVSLIPGPDGSVLVADSTQTGVGLRWGTFTGGIGSTDYTIS